MSAIFGIFRIDGQDIDPKLIKDMGNVLGHRGPDGSGVWLDGSVALGHQMLHTTPESLLEKLPFKDETTGMVITADARIDNRDELSPLLNLENSKEVPDSLFILKAYKKWGEDCPDKLLGDFAFVIWDPVNECLFCARDHMGVKPFYYYLSDDSFYFATEMKAILTLPDVPRKLNELKVAFYLKFMVLDKELTFYDNIFRLPGANSIKIDQHGHEIRKYWELDLELKIKMDSEEDYINAFREIFQEAVSCRLRSAFPIGFEMSGGLDSSSVVGMAKKILNEKNPEFNHIETFSYVSDEVPNCNERDYIEMNIIAGGIKPTFIHGDKISPFEEIETILQFQDQPFFSPNASIFRNLYKIMREKKIRITLNGEGGDHISAIGPNYFKELFLTLQFKVLIREIHGLSKIIHKNCINIFISFIIFPLIPRGIKDLILKVFEKKTTKYTDILNKNFLNKLGGEKYLKEIIRSPIENANTTRKYHYLNLACKSIESGNEFRDLLTGEFSIESRFPFRDKRMVEFCFGVPNEIKFKYGWNRYLHRVAMKDIIPKEIQFKSFKSRGGPPLYQRNLLLFEKKCLEEIICNNNDIWVDYLDLDVLKKIYHKYKSGNMGNDLLYLWFAVVISHWFQMSNISN